MKNANSLNPQKAELVEVNGTKIYYEVYGEGEPLFFLHGYTQSSIAWKDFVAEYANDYEVYLVDLRGHGKSEAFKETFSVKESAKDILDLIKYLSIEKIKAVGVSFGGDVLLQISIQNINIIESMILVGANGDWNAQDFPEMLETFKFENIEEFQWIYDFHSGDDERIKSIIQELANYKIKLSEDEVRNIKAKTLLILGDNDGQISIESVVKLNNMLSESHLWIVPNTSHFAHDGDNKKEFVRISKNFLGEKWKQ